MNAAETAPAKPPRKWVRRRAYVILIVGLLAAAVLYPPTFQWGVRALLLLEAKRENITLTIRHVDGSVFEPVRLEDVHVAFSPPAGVDVDLTLQQAQVTFSPMNVFRNSGRRFVDTLKLMGGQCSLRIVQEQEEKEIAAAGEKTKKRKEGTGLFGRLEPTSIQGEWINVSVRQGRESVQFRNVSFSASNIEPGEIWFEEIALYGDWFRRKFSNVTGKTSVDGSHFTISDLAIEPGIDINSITADIAHLSSGALRLEYVSHAFDGEIRGELVTEPHRGRLNLDVIGNFSHIAIAKVADFLEYPGAAGGSVKEGKVTFSGSPRNLERATVWTRLEADDFRWGKRRWDSLVVGATLVNRRLELPELRLRQGGNTVNLSGEVVLPAGGEAWWKSDFRFDLQADIRNLTELSSLLGPEFENAYGRLSVDGSIRGSEQQFGGQLLLSGSQLSWRGAPLDTLQAGMRISENELQIANLEFSHGYDYLRAKGVVNILGERQYSGELKASVADLALYDGILRPPLLPVSPAGGLNVEWSGDGTSKAHSGVFKAIFQKLRPLVSSSNGMLPIDASIEGSYSPGNIFLSEFHVVEGATAVSAGVTVSPAAIDFQGLSLRQGKKVTLEGNAKLPIDIWTKWPNPKVDVNGAAKVQLAAKDLELNDLFRVVGKRLPLELRIDGTASGDTSLSAVLLSGSVKGAGAPLYRAPFGAATGDIDLTVSGACAVAQVNGEIRTTNIEFSPKLDLNEIAKGYGGSIPPVPKLSAAPFGGWNLNVAVRNGPGARSQFTPDLKLTGSATRPSVEGTIAFHDLRVASAHLQDVSTSGTVLIEKSEAPAPGIEATVHAQGGDRRVTGFISGPLAKPETRFVTDPPMEEAAARELALDGKEPPKPEPSPTASPEPAAAPEAPTAQSPTPAAAETPASESPSPKPAPEQ